MLNVLLVVVLALGFVPNAHGENHPPTSKPAQGANPSPITATPTIPQKPTAETPTQSTGDSEAKDEPKSVRIILPAKDKYDYWAFGINAVLAGVGIIGIGVGVCTLIYLRKQAGEMRLQRKVMVRSLRAMREQGERENKTIVLQYRPRVIVRNAKATGLGIEAGGPGICTLEFLLVNTGGSPANIIEGSIFLLSYVASDIENIRFIDGPELHIGERVLQAGERSTIKEESMKTGTVNDAQWMLYYSGKNSDRNVLLMGTIWYKDEIGITRQTGLHRLFDPKTGRFEPKTDNEQEYSD
jgi:hypothetical protein